LKLYLDRDGELVSRHPGGFSNADFARIVSEEYVCDLCDAHGLHTVIEDEDKNPEGLCDECLKIASAK
jgi:hypothetical protein